jgi:hypothetical protein
VKPQPLLDLIRPDVDAVVSRYSQTMTDEKSVAYKGGSEDVPARLSLSK